MDIHPSGVKENKKNNISGGTIMYNLNNNGTTVGRLTKDPVFFTNGDNSRKVKMVVAATDNYKTGDKYEAQFIPLEAFIPAGKTSVYDQLHTGDKIMASYQVKNKNYISKQTGQPVYEIVLQIDSIQREESKSITDARAAQRAAAEAAAASAAEDAAVAANA